MSSKYKSQSKRSLGLIQASIPSDHSQLSPSKLFRYLCNAGDWTYSSLSDAIKTHHDLQVSEDAIKSWGSNARQKIPTGPARQALIDLIQSHCTEPSRADEWIDVLIQSWGRKKIAKQDDPKNNYINLICHHALHDKRLTLLPSLFGNDTPLPLATTYVDLRLAPVTPKPAKSSLLEQKLTLAQRIMQRFNARYAARRDPQDVLDGSDRQTTLILGAPGSGKSSLLRRVALDIASGKWHSAKAPLFVEARAYWASRKSSNDINLVNFALENTLPLGADTNKVRKNLFSHANNSNHKPVILLLDGLDEIAADPLAVQVIYDELQRLSGSIAWIATCRPAGLMTSLGENIRCEMVDLDEDSIECLIDNWCQSSETLIRQTDPLELKSEIIDTPGTREMAGNPFLLMALCFLKSASPTDHLPKSRICVYESLMDQISLQTQRRHANPEILSPKVCEALQDFVFGLYTRSDGPIQIFSREHWWQYLKTTDQPQAVDLFKHILPGRLLSEWQDDPPHYHFLHLSMQEHLVARSMLNGTVDEALAYRFSPVWRSVFRFYGALLWQRGRTDEFQALTNALCEEQDINGYSFLTLAYIFADAGIKDTRDWLGDDLRDTLYHLAIPGPDVSQEAMIEALAALDPGWLEQKVCESLEEKAIACIRDDELIIGHSLDSPYEILARTRSSSAKSIIAETFWGKNQNLALMSACAFADVATPSQRQEIIDQTKEIDPASDFAFRIFAFAQASLRPEFVPFLGQIVGTRDKVTEDMFQDCLKLIAEIGGNKASDILEQLVLSEVYNLSSEYNTFELLLSMIVRLGGREAARILSYLATLSEASDWHETIAIMRFEADPSNDDAVLAALSDKKKWDDVLSSLCGAANYGRLPSESVVIAIKEQLDVTSINNIMDLAFIESSRLENGEAPLLCESLLVIAQNIYARLEDPDDENDRDYLITQLQLVFDPLGRAPWYPAKNFIRKLLLDRKLASDLLEATISLAGLLFASSGNLAILNRLKEVLFELNTKHSESSALAIGRIDLEEMNRLQDAEGVFDAMSQIAAEQDLLIFDSFWADRFGLCTEWKIPPKKILHAYSEDSPEIAQIMIHELSRYGFIAISDTPKDCAAYIIYQPSEGYAKELEEQARQLTSASNATPLYDISTEITEHHARRLAQEIGQRLTSQSH